MTLTNLERDARAKLDNDRAILVSLLNKIPGTFDAVQAANALGRIINHATFLGSVTARREVSEARSISARVGGACDNCGNHGCLRCGRTA